MVGASLTQDRFGNANSAYWFDGVNDYIDIGNPTLVNFTDDFSFSAWIQPDSSNTYTWPTIISKWSGSSYYETFWFGLRQNRDGLGGEVSDDLGNHYRDDAVVFDQWQHVAMTYDKDAQTMALYVDGNLLQSWTNFGGGNLLNDPTRNILIGAIQRASLLHLYKGAIDDVRIFNHALNADEVKSLYIPKPTTVVIWTLLAALGAAAGWWRRRVAA